MGSILQCLPGLSSSLAEMGLGMGIENRFLFRTGSQWIDSLESIAKFFNDSANGSLCRCACADLLLQTAANMATRQKRSKVWLYFTRQNDNNATCNACKKSISSKGGNTTNMKKHLNTQHGLKLQECHVFDACSSAANVSASSLFLTIQGKLLKVITTTCVKQFAFIVCSRSSYLLSRRLKLWEMFYRNGVNYRRACVIGKCSRCYVNPLLNWALRNLRWGTARRWLTVSLSPVCLNRTCANSAILIIKMLEMIVFYFSWWQVRLCLPWPHVPAPDPVFCVSAICFIV